MRLTFRIKIIPHFCPKLCKNILLKNCFSTLEVYTLETKTRFTEAVASGFRRGNKKKNKNSLIAICGTRLNLLKEKKV